MAKPVRVKIQRFDPDRDSAPWFQEFTVPYEEGMNALFILDLIYEEHDPTIAYEGTCKCALSGACKLRVNEKTVLACDRLVKEGEELVFKPAEGHQLIRDLVVDLDGRNGREK